MWYISSGWAKIALPEKSDYDWTEVKGIVTAPPPKGFSGDRLDIHVFLYTRSYGELWIDDVRLTSVD